MAVPWIKEAESHLGFHEGANNENPFGRFYGIPNQPWCALFVSYCCAVTGHRLPVMQAGMKDGYAACYIGMEWAKTNGYWRPSWKADRGDAVIYGWDGPSSSPSNMHTGFITAPGSGKGSRASTIEGNRADQVERNGYTVGADIVLGTIAITQIIADLEAARKNKKGAPNQPSPQPRHPHHPHNSGPTSPHHGPDLPYGWLRNRIIPGVANDLENGMVAHGDAHTDLARLTKAFKEQQ